MVVLVLVVVRAVLELAQQVAGVVMSHVVVVVDVDDGLVRMLVPGIAHHPLHHGGLLHAERLLVGAPASHRRPPPPPQRDGGWVAMAFRFACAAIGGGAVGPPLPQSVPRAVDMTERFVTRGFVGRRDQAGGEGISGDERRRRTPPGQYLTGDFPVLSAGPTP